MKEIINARKQMNQERLDALDRERFEVAKKIRDDQEDAYDKVHSEFKSVAEAMEYNKNRRLAWSKDSLKTTNDELWTENMPLYIQSETNPEMRAKLEKEFRMHKALGNKAGPDATPEEVKAAEEESKEKATGAEAKEEKKEEKVEEKKAEEVTDKPEKKEEKKIENKIVSK
jgi:hypothetical protein